MANNKVSPDVQRRIDEMKKRREEEGYDNPVFTPDRIVQEAGKEITEVPLDKLKDAPEDWNFYPPITEDKMVEMIFSIMENGLFNPIIVWDQGTEYMILAGHNRVQAYRTILDEYSNSKDFNEDDFLYIPAIIYDKNEIDENKAKEIIIDSNYIQRKEDRRLAPIIIKERMDIVRNRKDFKGRTMAVVAEEMDISQAKVSEDYSIATELSKKGQGLYFDGHINKKAALRLAWLSKEDQDWIIDKYGDKVNSKMLLKIEREHDRKTLEDIFDDFLEGPKTVNVNISVPEDLAKDFREMANEWIVRNS